MNNLNMQPYYSIISININHTLQERIGIGMLLISGEQQFFRLAEDKINLLKGLLTSDKLHFVKTYMRNLRNEIENNKRVLLLKEASSSEWYTQSYISYLNKYANNLLHFSEPKSLTLDVSDEVFENLFRKWIFKS